MSTSRGVAPTPNPALIQDKGSVKRSKKKKHHKHKKTLAGRQKKKVAASPSSNTSPHQISKGDWNKTVDDFPFNLGPPPPSPAPTMASKGRKRKKKKKNLLYSANRMEEHGVTVDTKSKFGLRGLDQRYETLLSISGITKNEVINNPEAVVALLEFHMEGPVKIRTRKVVEKEMEAAAFIKKQNPRNNFIIEQKLGEGGIGTVFSALDKRNNKKCAIKVADAGEHDMVQREIQLQALSKHINILEYMETYIHNKKLFIVLELMDGGSLTSVLGENDDIKWAQRHVAYVCREVFKGLAYLHQHFRIHRDIKSDNILVDKKGRVKIADLGNAVTLTSDQRKRKTIVGTPYWMAPEVIRRLPYDFKADIWSVGITVFEMCENEPPHFDEEPLKALLLISVNESPKLKNPDSWSPELNHFVSKAVEKSPEDRGSASQLLMHPFIQNFSCKEKDFGKFVTKTTKLKKMKNTEGGGIEYPRMTDNLAPPQI